MTMTKVLHGLYLGDIDEAEALVRTNPQQIRTVVTLCREPVEVRSPKIAYMHFPMVDSRPMRIDSLSAILQAIESAFAKGSILVHCTAGISRSPAVLAAFLFLHGFPSYGNALTYLKRLRPEVHPSPVLAHSIRRALLSTPAFWCSGNA
jgi:protein-tyrosine phosphatase